VIIKDLNFLLEREKRIQKDQKDVGQYPDIADYMRLYNAVVDIVKNEEQIRRRRIINKIRKKR